MKKKKIAVVRKADSITFWIHKPSLRLRIRQIRVLLHIHKDKNNKQKNKHHIKI